MAAPTFVGATAKAGTTGDATPDLSTVPYQADDIIIVLVQSSNQAITAPTGYSEIGTQTNQAAGTAATAGSLRGAAFWKRASASETNPTVPDTGDHTIAQALVFRGCATFGDPWDVIGEGGTAAASDFSWNALSLAPTVTTTVDDTLVFGISFDAFDGTSGTLYGTWVCGTLAGFAELTEAHSASGTGGGFGTATGTKATAGVIVDGTNNFTANLSTNAANAGLLIALRPPSATITEADGSAAGAGASSVAGAAIWDSVSSAAGVAAAVVIGAALWVSDGSAAGLGAASGAAVSIWDSVCNATGSAVAAADGENASGGFTEADASSSGAGAASAVAAALWATNSSASGTAASSAVAVALWATNVSASGNGVAAGISEAPEITIFAGQVAGSTARIGVASSTAKIAVTGSELDIEKTD